MIPVIVVCVGENDIETALPALFNVRYLSAGIDTVVDNQTARPLTGSHNATAMDKDQQLFRALQFGFCGENKGGPFGVFIQGNWHFMHTTFFQQSIYIVCYHLKVCKTLMVSGIGTVSEIVPLQDSHNAPDFWPDYCCGH